MQHLQTMKTKYLERAQKNAWKKEVPVIIKKKKKIQTPAVQIEGTPKEGGGNPIFLLGSQKSSCRMKIVQKTFLFVFAVLHLKAVEILRTQLLYTVYYGLDSNEK